MLAPARPTRTLTALLLCLLSCSALIARSHAATRSDLDSQRLLAITAREDKLYAQVAADPEYYSHSDLQRRIDPPPRDYSA